MYIDLKNISKGYSPNKRLINNLSLRIDKGITGVLGENGAGKTTLLKIISSILKADEGEIEFMGLSLPKNELDIRRILGYLPQNFDFFGNITVFEMLDYIARLKVKKNNGNKIKKEILEILEMVNLLDQIDKKIKQLSGGMKQRLGIAQSLLNDPAIIILDEPTVGLDPIERIKFRNMLNKLSKEKIIIISTHIISDVSMLCENIVVMSHGSILYSGELSKALDLVDNKINLARIKDEDEIPFLLHKYIISIDRKKEFLEVRYVNNNVLELEDSYKIDPTLEDAYFYLMINQ